MIAVLVGVSLLPLGVALLGFLRLVVTRARDGGADIAMTGVGCEARGGRIQAFVDVLDCKQRIGLGRIGGDGLARDHK